MPSSYPRRQAGDVTASVEPTRQRSPSDQVPTGSVPSPDDRTSRAGPGPAVSSWPTAASRRTPRSGVELEAEAHRFGRRCMVAVAPEMPGPIRLSGCPARRAQRPAPQDEDQPELVVARPKVSRDRPDIQSSSRRRWSIAGARRQVPAEAQPATGRGSPPFPPPSGAWPASRTAWRWMPMRQTG